MTAWCFALLKGHGFGTGTGWTTRKLGITWSWAERDSDFRQSSTKKLADSGFINNPDWGLL